MLGWSGDRTNGDGSPPLVLQGRNGGCYDHVWREVTRRADGWRFQPERGLRRGQPARNAHVGSWQSFTFESCCMSERSALFDQSARWVLVNVVEDELAHGATRSVRSQHGAGRPWTHVLRPPEP